MLTLINVGTYGDTEFKKIKLPLHLLFLAPRHTIVNSTFLFIFEETNSLRTCNHLSVKNYKYTKSYNFCDSG